MPLVQTARLNKEISETHTKKNYVTVISYTMDLQKVGSGGMDWIELVQDRDRWQALVSAVMNLRVP